MIKNKFLKFCSDKKFEENINQKKTLDLLIKFNNKENFLERLLSQFFLKNDKKLGFYLHGGVGVGKTMILNFFFNNINIPKQRKHFNEFMIEFHDFRHNHKNQDKDNYINAFIKNL